MTILKHELHQGRFSLLIWSAAVSVMLGICILIYPEMAAQMEQVSVLFAAMGTFSQAFGMDRINFGEFIGFFGIECGNVLGLGGALFAALVGTSALSKEESLHTAEFLLTHPISRTRIIAEKLAAAAIQILLFNLASIAVTAVCTLLIGETADFKLFALLFLAFFLMQLETAAITFGISAFLRRDGIGLGLGLAAVFYFLNLVANMIESTAFLKYFTPFGFADSADIIADQTLRLSYLAAGILIAAVSILLAFRQYRHKDIS